MNIVGVDPGRYKVKVWHGRGFFDFYSNLGEYRDPEFEDEKGEDDFTGEYCGLKFSGGTLAQRESEYGDSMMTESKLHQDTVILTLIALHRSIESGEVGIVTGLPVKYHKRDKGKLKQLIEGRKRILINGVEKTFDIHCEVLPECSSIYRFATEGKTVRGINVGSRTVNALTFQNGQKIGQASDTFDFGMETGKSKDPAAIARAIASCTGSLKWKREDDIRLIGGGAAEIQFYLDNYYENISVPSMPRYADARAFFDAASEIYGR
jgi:plasmid segregation protein ParM